MSISNPSMVETCSVPILFDLEANKRVDLGTWVLNNRREFPDFLNQTFLEAVNSNKRNVQYAFDSNTNTIVKVELLRHQKFISDFLSRKTPYRGCLLYYGLGSGKTLSSINIAEGINQKSIVLLPASIRTNFVDNIQKKGNTIYHTQNQWCFMEMSNPQSSQNVEKLSKMGFPVDEPELMKDLFTTVNGKNGFWVVQKDPGADANNYDSLSPPKQESIRKTVRHLIDYKYHFAHYNGGGGLLRKIMQQNIPTFSIQEGVFLTKYFPGKTYEQLSYDEKKKYKNTLLEHIFNDALQPHFQNPFENKVIIIDEVHNFISQLCNNSDNAIKIYQLLMRTHNSRIVALSGTPVINSPFELCVLFNLLKGYTIDFRFKIKAHPDLPKMMNAYMKKQTLVDNCVYKPTEQLITFSRMPFGFRRNEAENAVRDVAPFMDDAALIADFKKEFAAIEATFFDTQFNTIYPDIFLNKSKIDKRSFVVNRTTVDSAKDKFYEFYVDRSTSSINNEQDFLMRCLGLISFFNESYKYGSQIFPEKIQSEEPNWVNVSDFQLIEYNRQREKERLLEKRNIGKNDVSAMVLEIDTKVSNVFKVFSRQKLLFSFPPGIERPELKKLRESVSDGMVCSDALAAECSLKDRDLEKLYDTMCIEAIDRLTPENLTINASPFGLQVISPKYAQMLENINSTPGIIFCYSQFRNVEGIEIFCRVLNANGYERYNPDHPEKYTVDNALAHVFAPGQMVRYEAEPDHWVSTMVLEIADDKCKINISGEERLVSPQELYRCRYATWSGTENVAQRETIRQNFNNLKNKFGQVLLIILATSSGAEGIDLMNVRQVHIMEPYWNKVREEQVIGRARRNYSHINLPKDQQNVKIFQYVSRFSKDQVNGTWGKTVDAGLMTVAAADSTTSNDELIRQVNIGIKIDDFKTSDEALLTISNHKYELISKFLDVIKRGAVDCEYNKEENILSSQDGKAIDCLTHIPGVGNSITFDITSNPEIREEGQLETIIGKELYIINYPGRNLKLMYEINKGEQLTQTTSYVPLYNFYSYYGINPLNNDGNSDQIRTKRLIGSVLFDKDVGKMKIILSQEFMDNTSIYEKVQSLIGDKAIPSIDQSEKIYRFAEEIRHHPEFSTIERDPSSSQQSAAAPETKTIRLNIIKKKVGL